MSGQLELAELGASRARLAEAEVRALRAQISPHFIYNSLGAIASFVRTDPDRARELLLEFADFTRYSFRRHGEFTTLSEELRSVERYLLLEQARFGDRLQVTLSIAPEVLPVAVPFLCIQPLVENAVRHGLEGRSGVGHITITARDRGQECVIEVEDDGAGEDPDVVRRALAGDTGHRLGRARQRRRAAAHDVRRRPRAGRRDRPRRGHQGDRAGAEVRRRRRGPRPGRDRPVSAPGLRVLVVDDERPDARRARLPAGPRPARRPTCAPRDSATDGLRVLREDDIDCVFLDIQMPGLSGLELAEVLQRFRTPPAIVFVTAHDEHAVDAFDLRAVDYVLKPVRAERLAEAVRRVVDGADARHAAHLRTCRSRSSAAA